MIFDRVLVPLDGSALAEACLPAAEALGRHLNSTILLAHCVESDPPAEVHGQPHLATMENARQYLAEHQTHLTAARIRCQVHVQPAQDPDVAVAINILADTLGAECVLMCGHGRRSLAG